MWGVSTIETATFGPARAWLGFRARDMTHQASSSSALVVAPHPDDETLGCGATIARKTALGHRVRVVIVTDGRRSHASLVIPAAELATRRKCEVIEACAALGVPQGDVVWLGHEDQRAAEHRAEIAESLTTLAAEMDAEEVYSPSPVDRNADHRAIGEAVRGLVRERNLRCAVYEYPIWFWTLRTWAGPGRVTGLSLARAGLGPARAALAAGVRLVRTDEFISRKHDALARHASQMMNLTGEADWETLAPSFLRSFFGPHELFFAVNEPNGERHG
jgi:LmbE family N-acetylglucosaminyl deacetylase